MPSTTLPDREVGLWFHKMSSGGRGEYEVTGAQGSISSGSLVNHTFELVTPFGVIDTGLYLGTQGGKRRVRALDGAPGIQLQAAALLLLPPSTRSETAVSSALPVLLAKRYIMDIAFDAVEVDQGVARCQILSILARSGDIDDVGAQLAIDANLRFSRIGAVLDRADLVDDPVLPQLLRAWRAEIGVVVTKRMAELVGDICAVLADRDLAYLPGSDPLPILELLAGVSSIVPSIPLPVETPVDAPEIRLRSEHIYRMQRARSATAVKFAKDVQRAYRGACVFCGFRAPGVKGVMRAGVDAAHILPYGSYDLDVVANGLVLCKLHHWAFDNHVLVLAEVQGSYFVTPDEKRFELLSESQTTVNQLRTVVGKIDEERLPRKNDRPSAQFIGELYAAWP